MVASWSRSLVVTAAITALFATSLVAQQTSDITHAEQERDFIVELNKIRTDPSSFITTIDEYYYQWRSFVADVQQLERAVAEIKKRLKKQQPLQPLTFDSTLQHAAADHALDCLNMNLLGHIGSDKSDPKIRIERYGKWSRIAECINYGQKKVAMMLAAMLVDEGTPSRLHRESLLSPSYTHIGVSIMSHPRYTYQIVVEMGEGLKN